MRNTLRKYGNACVHSLSTLYLIRPVSICSATFTRVRLHLHGERVILIPEASHTRDVHLRAFLKKNLAVERFVGFAET